MNMRAALITIGSVLLTSSVIGNAYYQKKQFYPSVVYITKSNPSMAIIYLQAFVFVLLMGKLMRKIFFGQLRTAEMEHLIERSWYAVTETCLAFTVFRDDLSPKFVGLFTFLLFLKCFHWLAEDRVDYMERSPNISLLFHIRVISLLTLLGTLDFLFVHLAYHSTLSKGASVQLVFGFEYAILFAVVLNILMKYVLHFVDLQNENPWEDKAVYLLYTELIMGFLKVILYLTFITIMMKIHTFPLFAIRPMYLSMRAFKKALNDVIMSRRAIRNMNTLYPNATPEELQSVDNVCIICREEMTGNGSAKKLPCNHIFHVSCLRSWFQRQQTCPTCRMDVLRATNPNVNPNNNNNNNNNNNDNQAGQQQQQQQQPHMGARFQAQFVIPPNVNMNFQPNFQPFFAMPPVPPQPQQAQQPNPNDAQNVGGDDANINTNTNPVNQGASSTSQPNFTPFMPIPPFMPFFAPPMPAVPSDLSGLSVEELQAMEGNERANIEARMKCLRNVQTLLDAAVIQLHQYSSVATRMTPTMPTDSGSNATTSSATPSPAAAAASGSPTDPIPSSSTQSTSNTHPNESLSHSPPSPSDPQEMLRQRRLQRFSQTSPPTIDPKTGTVVSDREHETQASTSSSTTDPNMKKTT